MKRFFCCMTIQVFLAAGFSFSVYSQTITKKTYETAFADTAPLIDGFINDSCWNKVPWGSGFIQMQPYENRPPAQQTAFKILYDNDNLYVYIKAYDSHPDSISRRMTRRDNFDGDMVEINIDSYYDQQTAFSFTAMASGVKGDEAVTQNGNNWDPNWNPVWYLKTSIDEQGWNAEMKIPLSQLRFGKKSEHVWGIQFNRVVFRSEERSTWQYIPKGSPGLVHLFGELHGINNIRPKRQIELLPYVVAKTERFQKQEGNPFLDGKSGSISAGIDGKAAITNDLTLDFSINPDFGQVEADPSEVNLTVFETFFSERRPLFIEGKNIYDFKPSNTIVISNLGSDNLFYSRRIGRYPHYYPKLSDNEYVDMPDASRIIGALKLSGKTKNGFSIGILESVTADEKAVIDSLGVRRNESVEPLTNFFVGRVQKDINKGKTVIGGLFTAVNRDIQNPALNFLPFAAYTGGIDFRQYWKERTWYFAGNMEFSTIHGSKEAILAIQKAPARYFQRSDSYHHGLDSSKTILSGYGSTLKLGRSSQKKWQFETSVTMRSPGLEFNDVGYMRSTDLIHHGTWVAYYLRDPFSIFRNFFLNTNYWMNMDYTGKLLSFNTNMNFNTQLKNRWRINGNFTRIHKNVSATLLRGGPSFVMPGALEINLNLSSDQTKKVNFYAGNFHGIGDENSYQYHEYWAGLFFIPINALNISIEPGWTMQTKQLQYVEEESYLNKPRYIFASLKQNTFSFVFRLNFAINPELSLEYYGQPFVSAGKYSSFKRITNPEANSFDERFYTFSNTEFNLNGDTYDFDENGDNGTDYSVENPDFNVREFKSNFVIRWEYRPGSTLFLVWSQNRNSTASDGSFSYGKDMKDLFGVTPHNVFLLKFSYWFAL